MSITGDGTIGEGTDGIVGDPKVLKGGSEYAFGASDGDSYHLATDGTVSVVFRAAATPSDSTKTYVDQVTITYPSHTVVVGLTSASVDGSAISMGASTNYGGGAVWYHLGEGGETRVDTSYGFTWQIACIQDPGTSSLHTGGPLEGVPHIGVFFDTIPSSGVTGLYPDVPSEGAPSTYLV